LIRTPESLAHRPRCEGRKEHPRENAAMRARTGRDISGAGHYPRIDHVRHSPVG
jgi:hypothetical protein